MTIHDLSPDLPHCLNVWQTYVRRSFWTHVRGKGTPHADLARRELNKLPVISALDALAANATAVEALVGRRWHVMQEALEAGVTWEDIGKALGVTPQEAQDYYRRQNTTQESLVPEFHDPA